MSNTGGSGTEQTCTENRCAAAIGFIFTVSASFGSLVALYHQNLEKAVVLGMFAFTAAWLFRLAFIYWDTTPE